MFIEYKTAAGYIRESVDSLQVAIIRSRELGVLVSIFSDTRRLIGVFKPVCSSNFQLNNFAPIN